MQITDTVFTYLCCKEKLQSFIASKLFPHSLYAIGWSEKRTSCKVAKSVAISHLNLRFLSVAFGGCDFAIPEFLISWPLFLWSRLWAFVGMWFSFRKKEICVWNSSVVQSSIYILHLKLKRYFKFRKLTENWNGTLKPAAEF